MKNTSTASPKPAAVDMVFHPENIKCVVALMYAIPSFIMSIIIIFVILTTFQQPFYRLFAVTAITDMLAWTFSFICMRARNAPLFFPFYAIFPHEGPLLTFLCFGMYYLVYVQYGTTFFLTLNRFSVMVLPYAYAQLWRKYFLLALLIVFVCPLPLTYHIIVAGGYLAWNNPGNPNDGYRLDVNDDGTGRRNSLFMMVGSLVLGIVLVVMNLVIAIGLYRRRRLNISGKADKEDTRDTEAKLFLLTVILFSFTVITFVNQILFFTLGNKMSMAMFFRLITLQNCAADLHTCSTPWFLMLMSRAIRHEVLKKVPVMSKFVDNSSLFVRSQATTSARSEA